jgi:thymidylate kinase
MRIEAALADLGDGPRPAVVRIATDEASPGDAAARVLEAAASAAPSPRPRGLLVAVVGPDGSGKSTLSRDLVLGYDSGAMSDSLTAASPSGRALHVYFGSGDGPSSLLRLPMKVARDRLLAPRAARRSSAGADAGSGDGGSTAGARPADSTGPARAWMRLAKAAWALALAAEKRRKLRDALAAVGEGSLVICDRYPQVQVEGRNDGPMLARWRRSRSAVLRLLGEWEARPYEEAARAGPDVVLRLDVDEATAASRRPGLDPAYLAERIRLVRSLRFDGARVVELDARRPYADVLAEGAAAIVARDRAVDRVEAGRGG